MKERDISVYLDQNTSITKDINAFLAFFLLLSPITLLWILKWEFCLTLISGGEVCMKLIRKSKRGGSSCSVCNIILTLLCECLGNKQSVGRCSV